MVSSFKSNRQSNLIMVLLVNTVKGNDDSVLAVSDVGQKIG